MIRVPYEELDGEHDLEVVEDADPIEFVPTDLHAPAPYDHHIAIDTVHDGWKIPERFLAPLEAADRESIAETFRRERDWGAHWVAQRLAERLELRGSHRVTVARALLDFNRFPGVTPSRSNHMRRLAVNPPFGALDYERKAELFSSYYDRISDHLDTVLAHRTVKISVHTYDQSNPSGTERPAVSLITRPESYQLHAAMPTHAFDPLFPAILGEFMSSRVLTYRLALSVEKRGVPVSLNFPYLMPDGAVEVRSQVWFFFAYLKRKFEAERAYRDPEEVAAFQLMWTMLLDTNLRSSSAVTFREYLHAFRRAPRGLEGYFERARSAYHELAAFLRDREEDLVEHYRYSKWRPSSLAIEVRKDFLWELRDGRPTHLKQDEAERVVDGLAEGVRRYLEDDLGVGADPVPEPQPVG
jgi:hypothetical protein